MQVHFRKYHGLGNDYLVIDPNVYDVDLTPDTVRLICDRHFGVGADGILYGPIESEGGLNLRIFNPDGSEAEKSGNGLRIFAKYLFDNKYVDSKNFSIETPGGIVEAHIEDDSANLVKINMGRMSFQSTKIPVKGKERDVVNEELQINGVKYKVTCLSVGNPHCVIPMDDVTEQKAKELGPKIENHDMFPNRINMQLLKVIDRANIEIRIWERGAGYTLASGSSSCAAAGAAHRLGLVDHRINVKMPGGNLLVEICDNNEIYLTGEVEGIFEGCFHADLEQKILGKSSDMLKESWPKLRIADNNDCEDIARLVCGILKEYGLKPDPACTDADLKDIESSYFSRGGTFFVLEAEDGSIVGAYGLYPIDEQTCELRKMYLQKAYRSKGLGKYLLEHALSKARRLGFERVILETASVLKEAIALYKSYGFMEFTPAHLSSRCDQAYQLELS